MSEGRRYSAEGRLAFRLAKLKKSVPPAAFAQLMAADGALKWCPKCKALKPIEEFHKNRRTWDGLQCRCKPCQAVLASASMRKRREDPEYREWRRQRSAEWWAAAKADGRSYDLAKQYHLKKYGLTPAKFVAMLAAQRYRCAICKQPLVGARDTHVDHDHACCPGGKSCGTCVRGLLCSDCNNGLGRFCDDPAVLRRAARYLERRPATFGVVSDDHGQGALWEVGA